MFRRGDADVDNIDIRIGNHVERIIIHGNARQIERLGIVAATDIPDNRRNVALALLGIHISQSDHLGILHAFIYAPMGSAHEAESHKTNLDLFHLLSSIMIPV